MQPDLSDEMREEVVHFIKRIEMPGLERTRLCSLSHSQKNVINEWRLCMMRLVFLRVALNVLCHSRTATPVVPMVPQRSPKWAGPLFWAATSIQRDVAPTGDESYTRNPLLGVPFTTSMSKGCPASNESTLSQPFCAKSRAAHLPTHSTKAAMPCGTGQYSFQRSSYPCKHQSTTLSNDLCVMHSSSGTMLVDGHVQQSEPLATAPPLLSSSKSVAPLPK